MSTASPLLKGDSHHLSLLKKKTFPSLESGCGISNHCICMKVILSHFQPLLSHPHARKDALDPATDKTGSSKRYRKRASYLPEAEIGLFTGAGPQGSTAAFVATDDGWEGAQGSALFGRGWAAEEVAGAPHGSTEVAGLAPAGKGCTSPEASQQSQT